MQCKQLPDIPAHRPVDCANMLRLVTTSLCLYCQRAQATPLLLTRPRSMIVQEENPLAINALYDLSVDISKVQKLRGWVFQKDLVGIIEKFPASFFTSSSDHDNQKANIAYFQMLHLNKRNISKLMASNPYALLKLPDTLHDNVAFLRNVGFTGDELLSMRLTLSYSRETLGCTEAELRQIVHQCPALLYYSVPILADRFKGLLTAGVSMEQIMETPTVLELTTQIVKYRIQKLRSFGYDVCSGRLEVLNSTKKDFEMSYGKLRLRQERPLFNPVAPLRTKD
uniref:Mitochondrial transcription termination factor 2 n=1 Tax=Sinocyclocheilus grahami TaxID=75366 RepID=A0A672PL09_SINGR